MKSLVLAAIAALTLTACASQQQCVQPDPVMPAHNCWSKGLDCGTGIDAAPVK